MQPNEKTTTLHSRMGGSDKVYVVQLRENEGDWTVYYQNGKRGSTLTTPKAKNENPLPYEAARKVFNDLVESKKKGSSKYVEDESVAIAYQAAPDKAVTGGFLPQLLNPIREPDLESYLKDDEWVAQEKMNGERRPARRDDDTVVGINKKGDAVALSMSIADSLCALSASRLLLDGEDMGDRLAAFDLLECEGVSLREMSFLERYRRLEIIVGSGTQGLQLVGIAIGEAAKRNLLARLRAENAEGIVFKRRSAAYSPGRPASGGDQIKFKFLETATCEVESVTVGKRSVSLRVYDTNGQPWSIGTVPIPPNRPIPAVGAFVEIEYLYAVRALFQAVYLGERRDQDRSDCTMAQIKFQAGVERLAA